MDRLKIQINRHKRKEQFESGSAKRKTAKEKQKKNEEVIAKSRRMTDYMKPPPSCSAVRENYDNTSSPACLNQPELQNLEDDKVVSTLNIFRWENN